VALDFGCFFWYYTINQEKQMSDYTLNPEAKAFSYTREQLFEVVCCIIAHPHTSITIHDKQRAAKIFLALQDYVGNYTQCYEDSGCFVDTDPALDFDTYVESIFDEDELNEIRKM
jgi:hypothetical protein